MKLKNYPVLSKTYGNKVICEVSSIFNIDLTSALFHASYIGKIDEIIIVLNDKCIIPTNEIYRKYVSRHSIPRLQYSLQECGNWHQWFEGIENNSNIIDLVDLYVQDILKVIDVENNEFSLTIKKHFDVLKKAIPKRYESPLKGYSILIKSLFSLIIPNIKSKIILSSELYNGKKYTSARINVFKKLIANKVFNTSYCLNHGGKITVFQKGEKIGTFDKIIVRAYFVELRNIYGNTCYLPKEEKLLKRDCFDFNYNGQLNNALLQELGMLADSPYYFKITAGSKTTEKEFITPIAVSDLSRVSTKMLGKGCRLNPSGYSIIEFKNIAIEKFVGSYLKLKRFYKSELDDWLFILNNYPKSGEKLSKYQGGTRSLIANLEKINRINLRNGNNCVTLNFAEISTTSFLQIGSLLIETWALINYIREVTSPNNSIIYKNNLNTIVHLSNDKSVNIDVFISVISHCLDELGNKFNYLHINEDYFLTKKNKIINMLIQTGIKEIHLSKNEENYLLISKLAVINKELKDVLLSYYSFVLFHLGAIFKSNILLLYLLFGEETQNQVISLINSRKEKYICYEPKYFV